MLKTIQSEKQDSFCRKFFTSQKFFNCIKRILKGQVTVCFFDLAIKRDQNYEKKRRNKQGEYVNVMCYFEKKG